MGGRQSGERLHQQGDHDVQVEGVGPGHVGPAEVVEGSLSRHLNLCLIHL